MHPFRLTLCIVNLCWFWQKPNVIIHNYSITQNRFTVLKVPVLHLLISPHSLWIPDNHYSFFFNHCSFYCLYSLSFFKKSCTCNHTACKFTDLPFKLRNICLRFLHIFNNLIAHLFLSLNNFPYMKFVYPFFFEMPPGCFIILAIMNKADINIHV